MHNYLLRYYLAEHGIDPEADVQLRVVPPPEMVANLRADNIDGFLAPDSICQRAIYDGVGKTTFLEGFKALGPTGRMILYGAASGRPDPIDPGMLVAGSWYVQRPTLGTYTRTPELVRERGRALLELIEGGALDVRVGARYPLEQARQAHEDLEARRTTGKLLLIP